MEKACKLEGYDVNTGAKIDRPEYTDRMLAHQYEKVGRFADAVKQWGVARRRVEEIIRRDEAKRKPGTPPDYGALSSLDVCDRNLALLYLRLAYRYGDDKVEKLYGIKNAYAKGVAIYERLASNPKSPQDVVDSAKNARADLNRRAAAGSWPHDALKPLDAGFQVSWTKAAPRVLIIRGKINLINSSEYKDLGSEVITHWYRENEKAPANQKRAWRDGCRVKWMLTDYDYKMPELETFDWKIDTTRTVIWDSLYVSGGTFSDKLDFSKKVDREFFPFKSDKYKLTVWYVPQDPDAPDYVQDRIGWKGEALTDKRYLDTKTKPGFNCLRTEFVLDKKDIL